MGIQKICMIALLGVALSTIIKQWKADFLPLIRLAFVILFGTAAMSLISPLLRFLSLFEEMEALREWIALPIKALGIAILTQICADICKESGENSLGNGVELVGKLEILLLCLPLMEQILSVAKELLSMGGST